MKIALTGASGRVGRGIAALALAQGHDIVGIDRVARHEELSSAVKYIQAEMDDYNALVAAFAGCDGLIHMAAIPSPGRHPDHVPTVEGDSNANAGYSAFGRLYAIGYIRGLREAAYGENTP